MTMAETHPRSGPAVIERLLGTYVAHPFPALCLLTFTARPTFRSPGAAFQRTGRNPVTSPTRLRHLINVTARHFSRAKFCLKRGRRLQKPRWLSAARPCVTERHGAPAKAITASTRAYICKFHWGKPRLPRCEHESIPLYARKTALRRAQARKCAACKLSRNGEVRGVGAARLSIYDRSHSVKRELLVDRSGGLCSASGNVTRHHQR